MNDSSKPFSAGCALREIAFWTVSFLILATLIQRFLPPLVGPAWRARPTAAKMQIESFKTALDAYLQDTGRYPGNLNALIIPPLGVTNWHGPYLEKSVPRDPWGHPYSYRCPGVHNTNAFDLYSCGLDGVSKSDGSDLDDINNWDRSSPYGGDYASDGRALLRQLLGLGIVLVALIYCSARVWWKTEHRKDGTDESATIKENGRKCRGIYSLPLVLAAFPFLPLVRGTPMVIGLWWGLGLMWAASGLKSGSKESAMVGSVTIVGVLLFLWHYHSLPLAGR